MKLPIEESHHTEDGAECVTLLNNPHGLSALSLYRTLHSAGDNSPRATVAPVTHSSVHVSQPCDTEPALITTLTPCRAELYQDLFPFQFPFKTKREGSIFFLIGSIKIQNSEDFIYIIKLAFLLLQENTHPCRISRGIAQKSTLQTGYADQQRQAHCSPSGRSS